VSEIPAGGSGSPRRLLLLTFAAVLRAVATLIDAGAISVHLHRAHERAVVELPERSAAFLLLLCCIQTYLDATRDDLS
jgi:hypothetical protein